MRKNQKGSIDYLVLATVIITLIFTSISVTSLSLEQDRYQDLQQFATVQTIDNYNARSALRGDDTCDDCEPDDDDDDPNMNDKPDAYIYEISPNPAQEFDSIYFEGYGEDVDGEIVEFKWESDIDGVIGSQATFNSESLTAGNHIILLYVKDNGGAWSDPINQTLEVIENVAPDEPVIAGKSTAQPGEEVQYDFIVSDINKDSVYFYIDWGDDSFEEWIGLYDSNEQVSLKHTWDEKGTYNIKAQAKDEHGAIGEWATMEVSMPKSKPMFNTLIKEILQKIISSYPILNNIL